MPYGMFFSISYHVLKEPYIPPHSYALRDPPPCMTSTFSSFLLSLPPSLSINRYLNNKLYRPYIEEIYPHAVVQMILDGIYWLKSYLRYKRCYTDIVMAPQH